MDKKGAFYEHKEFDLITFGETMLRLSPPVNELIYKAETDSRDFKNKLMIVKVETRRGGINFRYSPTYTNYGKD